MFPLIVLLVAVHFNMDFFQRNFGFSSVLFDIILLPLNLHDDLRLG